MSEVADERRDEQLERWADAIDRQNAALMERADQRDFDPVTELEYCSNGAAVLIHRFFEAVALYPEGQVPMEKLWRVIASTRALLAKLEKAPKAPRVEIDAVRMAFNEAVAIWQDTHDEPLMERRVYHKKHFAALRNFTEKLLLLHEAYLKLSIARPKAVQRPCKRRKREPDSRVLKQRDDRRRVLDEIARLTKKGYSVPKAIRHLRQNWTWKSRLGTLSDETWRNYYTQRTR